jgi:hypothetical protein
MRIIQLALEGSLLVGESTLRLWGKMKKIIFGLILIAIPVAFLFVLGIVVAGSQFIKLVLYTLLVIAAAFSLLYLIFKGSTLLVEGLKDIRRIK